MKERGGRGAGAQRVRERGAACWDARAPGGGRAGVSVWVPWAGGARCREEAARVPCRAREAPGGPLPVSTPPALRGRALGGRVGPRSPGAPPRTHLGAVGGARLTVYGHGVLESGREESGRRPSSGRRPPPPPQRGPSQGRLRALPAGGVLRRALFSVPVASGPR